LFTVHRLFERIVEFLDYPSRRICRLVSQKFKDYVDDIGLSIKLDNREADSVDLSRNVTATEAIILHMKSGDGDFDLLEADEIKTWKTAIISGPMDNAWLNDTMLRSCFNLRVLILNDDALTSEDFVKTQSDPIRYFHHLQELHISVKQAALRLRVQKNMAYFLEVIRSRVLKYFHASVYDSEPTADSWENQPLLEFLQNHHQSLEALILPGLTCEPEFDGQHALEFDSWERKKPVQLKQLKLARNLKRGYGNRNLSKRWMNFLVGQYSLEKVAISLGTPETVPDFTWLSTIVSNNIKTLTCIHISFVGFRSGNSIQSTSTLDMRLFSVLDSLRNLRFSGSQPLKALTIIHLNELPTKSLTNLGLSSSSVQISSDFDGIKFLESFNPKRLDLGKVSAEGFFKDPYYMLRYICCLTLLVSNLYF